MLQEVQFDAERSQVLQVAEQSEQRAGEDW
jgi:hypothetical protein